MSRKDLSAKIVLLGDSAVGKSSLALRFVRREFVSNQDATIGAAFLSRTIAVPTPNREGGGGGGSSFASQQQGGGMNGSSLEPPSSPASPSSGSRHHNNSSNSNTMGSSSSSSSTAAAATTTTPLKLEIWDTAGQERYRALAPMYYRGALGAIVVYDLTSTESYQQALTWVRELRRSAELSLVVALVGNKKDLQQSRAVETAEAELFAAQEGLLFFESSARDGTNVDAMFQAVGEAIVGRGLVALPGSGQEGRSGGGGGSQAVRMSGEPPGARRRPAPKKECGC